MRGWGWCSSSASTRTGSTWWGPQRHPVTIQCTAMTVEGWMPPRWVWRLDVSVKHCPGQQGSPKQQGSWHICASKCKGRQQCKGVSPTTLDTETRLHTITTTQQHCHIWQVRGVAIGKPVQLGQQHQCNSGKVTSTMATTPEKQWWRHQCNKGNNARKMRAKMPAKYWQQSQHN